MTVNSGKSVADWNVRPSPSAAREAGGLSPISSSPRRTEPEAVTKPPIGVHQRRLAGAVAPDQPDDLAALHDQADVVDRGDAAEVHAQVGDGERGDAAPRCSGRRPDAPRPAHAWFVAAGSLPKRRSAHARNASRTS